EDTLKALRYSDFKLFFTTGNRSVYEGAYFQRRHAAEDCAILSLIYPEEQVYIDQLMDLIYAMCDEYTWCLPAHQGQLDKNDNCRIDLFAAESAFRLAEMLTILGDRLEPLIKSRIMAEIDRRITTPFFATENYGWWENGNMNWTAVCMGSVACTMMLVHPELVDEKFIARVNRAMDNFIGGFKDDGICFEGCGYWGYGFGFFVIYADMIREFTDGRVDYFKLEKVKTIATFPQRMFLTGNACVSFADSGRTLNYDTGLLHYLKKEYPDDVLVYSPRYGHTGVGKLCTNLRYFLRFDPEIHNNPADATAEFESYAPYSEWMVKRTAAYGFAAKGGCNSEFHNHNDVGSFIFAKNGKQILMDLGSGVYTRQYFAEDTRYTFLESSSRGHSVPIIGGCYQGTGGKYKATEPKFENGVFSLDIAKAYPCEGLSSVKRSFSFTDTSVTLTDVFEYSGEGEITERIVTLLKPELTEPGKIKIDCATLTFDPSACECTVTEEKRERGDICYLIDFTVKDGEFTCTVE
ncbi:MAG: heparinase II/III family protein, partial [Clostridia bacterium]|nr:heparinase II/III family protein [Clostridia bacterium]